MKFAELRLAVGVGNRAGTQAVALMAMIQFNLGKTFQIQLALETSVNSVKRMNLAAMRLPGHTKPR